MSKARAAIQSLRGEAFQELGKWKAAFEAYSAALETFVQLAEDPLDQRLSAPPTERAGVRKSRAGGWRVLFSANRKKKSLLVLTVDIGVRTAARSLRRSVRACSFLTPTPMFRHARLPSAVGWAVKL